MIHAAAVQDRLQVIAIIRSWFDGSTTVHPIQMMLLSRVTRETTHPCHRIRASGDGGQEASILMFENLGSTIRSLKELGMFSMLNPAPSGVLGTHKGGRNKPLLTRRKAQSEPQHPPPPCFSTLPSSWATCTFKGGNFDGHLITQEAVSSSQSKL